MTTFLLIAIGVVIGASLIAAPFTKRIAAYIRPTIEGKDGKLSMKRATALVAVLLFVIAFFADLIADKTVSETLLYTITTILLGTMGITSWDTVQHHKNKLPGQSQQAAEEGQFNNQNSER
jgi:hypothetical protein